MNRLEILQKMTVLEIRKNSFEMALKDMEDSYHKKTEIIIDIDTNSYNKQYENQGFLLVDNELFKNYLDSEIANLGEELVKLLGRLYKLENE